MLTYKILVALSILLLIFTFWRFRVNIRERHTHIKEKSLSSSNFTIQIDELPLVEDKRKLMEELVFELENNAIPAENIKVSKVILCYNMDDYRFLQEQKRKTKKKQYLLRIEQDMKAISLSQYNKEQRRLKRRL